MVNLGVGGCGKEDQYFDKEFSFKKKFFLT